jgi:hypothetical protein
LFQGERFGGNFSFAALIAVCRCAWCPSHQSTPKIIGRRIDAIFATRKLSSGPEKGRLIDDIRLFQLDQPLFPPKATRL